MTGKPEVIRLNFCPSSVDISGDPSDPQSHCEDGAETGLALRNALIGLRSFG